MIWKLENYTKWMAFLISKRNIAIPLNLISKSKSTAALFVCPNGFFQQFECIHRMLSSICYVHQSNICKTALSFGFSFTWMTAKTTISLLTVASTKASVILTSQIQRNNNERLHEFHAIKVTLASHKNSFSTSTLLLNKTKGKAHSVSLTQANSLKKEINRKNSKSEINQKNPGKSFEMSLAEELNHIGDYGYIKFTDLVVGQKYKVHALKSYDSTINSVDRKCLRVDIDNGYLLMPERYDQKVETIHTSNVENLYIVYNGRQKGNRLDIHFVEEKTD